VQAFSEFRESPVPLQARCLTPGRVTTRLVVSTQALTRRIRPDAKARAAALAGGGRMQVAMLQHRRLHYPDPSPESF
jgi:hypothetical protein